MNLPLNVYRRLNVDSDQFELLEKHISFGYILYTVTVRSDKADAIQAFTEFMWTVDWKGLPDCTYANLYWETGAPLPTIPLISKMTVNISAAALLASEPFSMHRVDVQKISSKEQLNAVTDWVNAVEVFSLGLHCNTGMLVSPDRPFNVCRLEVFSHSVYIKSLVDAPRLLALMIITDTIADTEPLPHNHLCVQDGLNNAKVRGILPFCTFFWSLEACPPETFRHRIVSATACCASAISDPGCCASVISNNDWTRAANNAYLPLILSYLQ